VGTVFIGEVEVESGEAWRETSVNTSTFRIEGVNKLAMSYFTLHFETLRVEGQDKEGTGSHIPQRQRLLHSDITIAWSRRSYAVQ
jgi:hypothetical protein